MKGRKIGFGGFERKPCRKTRGKKGEELEIPKLSSASKRNRFALLYLCSLFLFPLLCLPCSLPLYTLYTILMNASDYNFSYLWQAPILSTVYILLFILIVSIATRILQYKMKPGIYPVHSFIYYRKWIKDPDFQFISYCYPSSFCFGLYQQILQNDGFKSRKKIQKYLQPVTFLIIC